MIDVAVVDRRGEPMWRGQLAAVPRDGDRLVLAGAARPIFVEAVRWQLGGAPRVEILAVPLSMYPSGEPPRDSRTEPPSAEATKPGRPAPRRR